MLIQLSTRVQRIKPSPTLTLSARTAELKAQGKNIVNLTTGEPDFDTPSHIKLAAIAAIEAGFTKYTPVEGIPELKQAICEKFIRENQLTYQTKQILVSCGAKQSLFNMVEALLNPGDEVIIPTPYWVSYPDMVLLADGKPVFIDAPFSQNYKITADQLAQAITPKTRLFILNSPSNPSGMAYTPAELSALAEVLLKHPHVLIASDDMYEHILWQGSFYNILNVCPSLYDRTIVVNGVSKAYAMTGWRIGYAAGPANFIAAMNKIQSQSTSNAASISQKAALAAISGPQLPIIDMVKAFKERHDYVYARLSQMEGMNVRPVDGTFYMFPNVEPIMQRMGFNNDVDFAEALLQAGVAVIPGSAFGTPGCIRISFATSMENLKDAMDRIEKFVATK